VRTSAAILRARGWDDCLEQIEVAKEDVLIIWDAENGIQHFIRRAGFLAAA
jgi:CO dehydrogenase nickel-insertion accessory protein CooC1